jgi:spore coat protein A, manganese oxidase
MKRREFLQSSFWSTASLLLTAGEVARSGWSMNLSTPRSRHLDLRSSAVATAPPALTPFVDPLPVPPVIRSTGEQALTIRLRQFMHKAHRDLAATRMWGYNGMWPGPTLEVRKGIATNVRWLSELPGRHFLPIDTTIHGADKAIPEVRTVTHLHGAKVMPEDDGYPEAWITPDGKTGPSFTSVSAHYPNDQAASTLWYHDHALGITRLNVYAGLAGTYVIRDREEDALSLPSGPFDIPLVLQDRSFNEDGSLHYPIVHDGPHPIWVQEFFGEYNCVNGRVAPYFDVEPRKYRFRFVNGSNSRFYHLTMVPASAEGKVRGKPAEAPPFCQIGSDGGLLPEPVMVHYLVIAPGERFDVVLDFSEHKDSAFAVINDGAAPYPRGGQVVPPEVLLFRVTKPLSSNDISVIPRKLVPFQPLDPADAVRERFLAVSEQERKSDGYTIIGLLGQKRWCDPITEDPKLGSTEIWSFLNTTGDVHPIHLHLARFQVLNRQSFDPAAFLQNQKVAYTGIPRAPEANERPAWKDTIKTYPGMITRIIAKFDLPSNARITPGKELLYVWHCHILEHEDNEMMRPYKLVS